MRIDRSQLSTKKGCKKRRATKSASDIKPPLAAGKCVCCANGAWWHFAFCNFVYWIGLLTLDLMFAAKIRLIVKNTVN